jgi:preprotein translocase subunit SecE
LTKGLKNVRLFLMPNIIVFLKEVKDELTKVAWPSREQTIRYTILVLIVAIAVGLFLGGLDYILTALSAIILK